MAHLQLIDPEPLSENRPAGAIKRSSLSRRLPGLGSFGANAVLTGATNLVIGALGVVTGAVVARLLGPHGRGELAAIQTWPILIGYLAMLGTGEAVVYYSAGDPDGGGRYLGTAATIVLLSAIPFMTAAFFFMPLLLSAQSPQVIAASRWYLLIVPIVGLETLPFFLLRGRGDFGVWNALRLTLPLVWIAILAIAWFSARRDPRFLAAAYLVAMALLCLPIGFLVRRRVPGSFLPERQNFRPLLRFGLPCFTGGLPWILNQRLDQMLMAGLLPPAALGFYVVAVAWSGAINPLINAVAATLFPRVASEANEERRMRAFIQGTRLAAVLALSTSAVLTALTPWAIVLLFGRKFQAAVPAGLILMPAAAIYGLNCVLEDGLRGLGRPVSVMQAEFAGLGVTVIALAVMLRPLGIIGASIASLLGYSMVSAVLLAHACRATGVALSALVLPSSREINRAMAQVRLLLRRVVPAPSRA